MRYAPSGWVWFSLPLSGDAGEALDVAGVVRMALEAVERAERTGDRAHLGPVLHWAHILKSEQTEAGDWPAAVNARTGEALGPARTLEPAVLLRRLEDILRSTEFSECIARAGSPGPEGAESR